MINMTGFNIYGYICLQSFFGMKIALLVAILLIAISVPTAYAATLQLVTENGNVFSIDFDEIWNIYSGYNSTATNTELNSTAVNQEIQRLMNSIVMDNSTQDDIDDIQMQIIDIFAQLNSNSTSTETEIDRLEDLIEDLGTNSTSRIEELQNLIKQLNQTTATIEIVDQLQKELDGLEENVVTKTELEEQSVVDGLGIQARIVKKSFPDNTNMIFGTGLLGEYTSMTPYVNVRPSTDFAALIKDTDIPEQHHIPQFWSEYSLGSNGKLDLTDAESENILNYAFGTRYSKSIDFEYKDTLAYSETRSPDLLIHDRRELLDTIQIYESGIVMAVSVNLDITHERVRDLQVDLITPDGTIITLHDNRSTPIPDISETYHKKLKTAPIYGAWALKIYDQSTGYTGTLNNWSLIVHYYSSDVLTTPNVSNLTIPSKQTITDTQTVSNYELATAVSVNVDITHPESNKLSIYLIAPDGTRERLQTTSSTTIENLKKRYTVLFDDMPVSGDWVLKVQSYSSNVGILNSWSLSFYHEQTDVLINTYTQIHPFNTRHVSDTQTVSGDGLVTNISVHFDITHSRPYYMTVELIAPDGTIIPLHKRSSAIKSVYNASVDDNMLVSGDWTLRVRSTIASSPGTLNGWSLALYYDPVDTSTYRNTPYQTMTGKQEMLDERVISDEHLVTFAVVNVDVTTTHASSTKIELLKPDGTSVILHNRQSSISSTYAVDIDDIPMLGEWTLKISQTHKRAVLTINSWSLTFYYDQSADVITKTGTPNQSISRAQPILDTVTISDSGTVTTVAVIINTTAYGWYTVIDLIAPDGSIINLHSGGSVKPTYVVSVGKMPVSGDWTLSMTTTYGVRTLHNWSLTAYYDRNSINTDDLIITGRGFVKIPLDAYHGQSLLMRGHTGDGTVEIFQRNALSSTQSLTLNGGFETSFVIPPNGYLVAKPNSGTIIIKMEQQAVSSDITDTSNILINSEHRVLTGSVNILPVFAIEEFTQTESPGTHIVTQQTISDIITIPDLGTVSNVSVEVVITGGNVRNYKISLVAPDGTVKTLKDFSRTSATELDATYNPLFNGVSLSGVWELQIENNSNRYSGSLDSWSLTIIHGDKTGNDDLTITGNGTAILELTDEQIRSVQVSGIVDTGVVKILTSDTELLTASRTGAGYYTIFRSATYEDADQVPNSLSVSVVSGKDFRTYGLFSYTKKYTYDLCAFYTCWSEDNKGSVGTSIHVPLTSRANADHNIITSITPVLPPVRMNTSDCDHRSGSYYCRITSSTTTNHLLRIFDKLPSYTHAVLQGTFDTEYVAQGKSYLYVEPNDTTITIRAEKRGTVTPFLKITDTQPNTAYTIVKNGNILSAGMSDNAGQIEATATTGTPKVIGGVLYLYNDVTQYRGEFNTLVFDDLHNEIIRVNTPNYNRLYVAHLYVNIPVTGDITVSDLRLDNTQRLPYLHGTYRSGEVLNIPLLPGFSTITMNINGISTTLRYADILGIIGTSIIDSKTTKITNHNPSGLINRMTTEIGNVAFAISPSDGILNAAVSETISGAIEFKHKHLTVKHPRGSVPDTPIQNTRNGLTAEVEVFVNGEYRDHIVIGFNSNVSFNRYSAVAYCSFGYCSSWTVYDGVIYLYTPETLTATISIDVNAGDFVEFYLYSNINGYKSSLRTLDTITASSSTAFVSTTLHSAVIHIDLLSN